MGKILIIDVTMFSCGVATLDGLNSEKLMPQNL